MTTMTLGNVFSFARAKLRKTPTKCGNTWCQHKIIPRHEGNKPAYCSYLCATVDQPQHRATTARSDRL